MKKLLRNILTLSLTAYAAIGTPQTLRADDNPAPKPNILFIMVDDLGKEWLSHCGSEDIKTPNIDALAKGGMTFNNAYSMPSCTSSRTMLLTGHTLGVTATSVTGMFLAGEWATLTGRRRKTPPSPV